VYFFLLLSEVQAVSEHNNLAMKNAMQQFTSQPISAVESNYDIQPMQSHFLRMKKLHSAVYN